MPAHRPLCNALRLIFAATLAITPAIAKEAATKTRAKDVSETSPAPPAATPAKPKPAPRTPESAVTPAIKDPNRHLDFLYRITQGEIGLLFLGDSITDAWPRRGEWTWLKFAPYNPADFGISGDRTEHLLWRITNGELDGINPKVTVVMIGTNNIGQNADEKPEWAAAGIKKIVGTIHEKLPNTQVLLLGVFPRATKDSPLRLKVDEINKIISKMDDGKQTRYLDIGSKFLDENGEIPNDVMPDKLHPSPKGYAIWYELMHPLLGELLKK